MSTPLASCFESETAFAYGVAGSLLVPMTMIGAAPFGVEDRRRRHERHRPLRARRVEHGVVVVGEDRADQRRRLGDLFDALDRVDAVGAEVALEAGDGEVDVAAVVRVAAIGLAAVVGVRLRERRVRVAVLQPGEHPAEARPEAVGVEVLRDAGADRRRVEHAAVARDQVASVDAGHELARVREGRVDAAGERALVGRGTTPCRRGGRCRSRPSAWRGRRGRSPSGRRRRRAPSGRPSPGTARRTSCRGRCRRSSRGS